MIGSTSEWKYMFKFSILLIFCSFSALSQKLDQKSMLEKLALMPADTQKVNMLFEVLGAIDDREHRLELAEQAYYISASLNYLWGQAKSSYHIGECLNKTRNFANSFKNLEVAQTLAEEIADTKLISDVLFAYGENMNDLDSLDSAMYYYVQSLTLADSMEYSYRAAEAHYGISSIANSLGNNVLAMQHILKAKKYYEELGTNQNAWHIWNLLGIIYDELSDQSKAFEYYYRALEVAKRSTDTNAEIIVSNNLAILYELIGKSAEAKELYWSAIEKAHVLGLDEDEAYLLGNIGCIFLEEKDTIRAQAVLMRSLTLTKKAGRGCDLAYPYEGMAELYGIKKEYDSASWYYDQAILLAKRCQNHMLVASALRHLGEIQIETHALSKGLKHLKESLALCERFQLIEERVKSNFSLYKIYKKVGDLGTALRYFEAYQRSRDLLLSDQERSEVSKVTANYEFEKKLHLLAFKEKAENLALRARLDKQVSNTNNLYLILALILILGISLGRSYYLMQRHNQKLVQINEEKNTLMGMVAHDLRSPLNNIKGVMSLVNLDHVSSQEQRNYTRMLNDSVDNMRDMIDRVMDMSAVEDMKINLDMTPCDVATLVNKVADNYEYVASKKNIVIHKNYDDQVYQALIDSKYTMQVFDNLMSNAIKYSDRDTNIYLSLERTGRTVIVRLRDEGQGITEEDQELLFTKYQQLSARPTGNEESIGLGLSIVKKFVDAMGATIQCESVIGEGSTFIVSFRTA
ncbi:ATP-binding protein [Reichenbachiella sp. MSK19-1]|uniref:ATP-binding protein n=1 Tax=Reichenbachiella sp. MSK19-1 TaxID=1897631 RepID=UPI000E6BA7E6|nr:ATP-binding protein [Reichenbachiella sp. MSK19-1]